MVWNLLASNPTLSLGIVLATLFVWWFVDEYRDADDREEAIRGTGRRARGGVESLLRYSRFSILGLAGLGATLSMEMLQLAAELNQVLGGAPVIVGHLLFGVLTFAGMAGAVPLTVQQLGFAFTFITVIALILRFSEAGGEPTS